MNAVVVVPTYNELENVGKLVEAIRGLPDKVHLLIVDDNSPDGTGRVADELSRQYSGEVFVYHRERKQGLGRAYVAAFQHILKNFNYAFVIQMDCDFSHDPVYIGEFLKAIQNADLVLGSRYITGINVVNWDFKRLLLSKFASAYVRLITGMPYTDLTGGFKCWRRTTLEALPLDHIFSMGTCSRSRPPIASGGLGGLRLWKSRSSFTSGIAAVRRSIPGLSSKRLSA